jgi:thiamine kinase-like enzyme
MAPPNMPSESPAATPYRDDASTIVPRHIDTQSPDFHDQVREVVREVCPNFVEEDLEIRLLSGGLSNELSVVTSSATQTSVLVRVHPSENHTILEREVENRLVAWLSKNRVAPIFYGRFENGRVEEFYDSVTPLSIQEMKDYAPKIARALSEFHRLDVPESVLPRPSTDSPSWFVTVDRWVDCILSLQDTANSVLFERIATEWKWLRSQLLGEIAYEDVVEREALRWIRENVLTHMDCQPLNVLKQADATNGQGPIHLIDFEYAGWNPRATDLANTLCEFCDMDNLQGDIEKDYPSIQIQNEFLRAYLEASCLEQPSDAVLRVLRHEIGRFTLVSHLGWAAWSGIMAKSAIVYDYTQYAQLRMYRYELHKEHYFVKHQQSP